MSPAFSLKVKELRAMLALCAAARVSSSHRSHRRAIEAIDDAHDATPHACARWCLPARSYARTFHAGLTSVVGQRPD